MDILDIPHQSSADTMESSDRISPLNKGLGHMDRARTASEIAALGWHLLREDLSLPSAVLYEDKIAHNLRWMQAFAASYGAKLAPLVNCKPERGELHWLLRIRHALLLNTGYAAY
jgi:hypothetical protein